MEETTSTIKIASPFHSGHTNLTATSSQVSLPPVTPPLATNGTPNDASPHQQLKKLYFKPSSTEALHSAILLKARNNNNTTTTTQAPTQPWTSQCAMPLLVRDVPETRQPKWTNANSLASLHAPSEVSAATTITVQSTTSSDDFDTTPASILNSMRSLKPMLTGLDALRSSSSDDEDSHTEVVARKTTKVQRHHHHQAAQPVDHAPLSLTLIGAKANAAPRPRQHSYIRMNSTQTNTSSYLYNYKTATTTAIPSLTVGSREPPKIEQLTSLQGIDTSSTTTAMPAIRSITTTTVTNNSNGVLSQSAHTDEPLCQLKRPSSTGSSKRGKEEALSSSSSDEEQWDSYNSGTNNNINKTLVPLSSSAGPHMPPLHTTWTSVSSTTNGPHYVTVTTPASGQKVQKLNIPTAATLPKMVINPSLTNFNIRSNQCVLSFNAPPVITPVVSASLSVPPEQQPPSLQMNDSLCSTETSVGSESDAFNSPTPSTSASPASSSRTSSSSSSNSSSFYRSQKLSLDHDYDSKYTSSSLSSASPISCCSNGVANDGTIDFQDDNSSTASGPIYVRQPGFEHHAHEVMVQQINEDDSETKASSESKVTGKDTLVTRAKKLERQLSGGQQAKPTSNNKAKKKLCMMNVDSASLLLGTGYHFNEQNGRTNATLQFKPIPNKAKREPLPMRLRAIPPSFWQEPNQANVSPATMYLPPLFKNEMVDGIVEDQGHDITSEGTSGQLKTTTTTATHALPTKPHRREVRISNANTDLLFKLFENLEQKDRKQLHLQMQQLKMHRNPTRPLRSISKALTKGEDPCIVDVVSDGLPLLTLDSHEPNSAGVIDDNPFAFNALTLNLNSLSGLSQSSPMIASTSAVASSSASSTDSSSSSFISQLSQIHYGSNGALPILHFEQNYSQALSDVVAAL